MSLPGGYDVSLGEAPVAISQGRVPAVVVSVALSLGNSKRVFSATPKIYLALLIRIRRIQMKVEDSLIDGLMLSCWSKDWSETTMSLLLAY
jgi:hypothetical protein